MSARRTPVFMNGYISETVKNESEHRQRQVTCQKGGFSASNYFK